MTVFFIAFSFQVNSTCSSLAVSRVQNLRDWLSRDFSRTTCEVILRRTQPFLCLHYDLRGSIAVWSLSFQFIPCFTNMYIIFRMEYCDLCSLTVINRSSTTQETNSIKKDQVLLHFVYFSKHPRHKWRLWLALMTTAKRHGTCGSCDVQLRLCDFVSVVF